MKYLVFIPAILLSGCFYQSVDQYDIQRAIAYCGSIDKIVSIDSDVTGGEAAKCVDKKKADLYWVVTE